MRSIELVGSLPACVAFEGGLDGLVKAFPRLQHLTAPHLDCHLNDTKAAWHVTVLLQCGITPGYLVSVNVEYHDYYGRLPLIFERLAGSPASYTYDLRLSWDIIRARVSVDAAGVDIVDFIGRFAGYEDLTVLLGASHRHSTLVRNSITWASFYNDVNPTTALEYLRALSQTSIKDLRLLVRGTITDFERILEHLQAPNFPCLRALKLSFDMEIDDWPRAKDLERLLLNVANCSPLALKECTIRIGFCSADGINGVANYWSRQSDAYWHLHYLPDVEIVAKHLMAIGGQKCDYKLLIHLESDTDDYDFEDFAGSKDTYQRLLTQAMYRLQNDIPQVNPYKFPRQRPRPRHLIST